MRWSIYCLFAFAFIVVEVSLRNLLVLRSVANIAPSFVVVLAVFVALFAPRSAALWGCWLLGLFVDLLTDLPHGAGRVGPLLGAHALGFTGGAYLLLQARGMVFRGRGLTVALLSVVFSLAANIVVVAIGVLHTWYPGEGLVWTDLPLVPELARRLGVAVYTGLLALVVGPILVWTIPIWSFRGTHRGMVWR